MFSQCSWLKCFKVIDSMLLQKWIYQAIKIRLNKMTFNIYKSVMFLETEKNNSRPNAFTLGQA